MIRTQDLAYAVENISRRDPEIGYALSELLAAGRIRIPVDAGGLGTDPCFLFEDNRVFVRKVSFSTMALPRWKKDWCSNTEKRLKNTGLKKSPPGDFFCRSHPDSSGRHLLSGEF